LPRAAEGPPGLFVKDVRNRVSKPRLFHAFAQDVRAKIKFVIAERSYVEPG
jgi:hypothetical protein